WVAAAPAHGKDALAQVLARASGRSQGGTPQPPSLGSDAIFADLRKKVPEGEVIVLTQPRVMSHNPTGADGGPASAPSAQGTDKNDTRSAAGAAITSVRVGAQGFAS